jgi:hypothetical protein
MSDAGSPIDELLDRVRASLHARRAVLHERVQRVASALASYERAVEAQIAHAFAVEHGLPRPPGAPLSPERAFDLLEAALHALPEFKERAPVERAERELTEEPSQVPSTPPNLPAPAARFPLLGAAVVGAKLVVIGALSGRDRSGALPAELGAHAEWIDTERDGAHAVGNLPQRLRQGRVAGVVILDRVVQHRHTEPVVAAARDAGVPIAFAGQGGKASLLRALEQLEAALASHTSR